MSEVPVERFRSLDAGKISATIERLCRRAEHRFPDSGLARVCRELEEVAGHTAETVMIVYSAGGSD